MKRTCQMFGSLALVALFPLGATAQETPDKSKPDSEEKAKPAEKPREGADRRRSRRGRRGGGNWWMRRMEQLNLSAEQKTKIQGMMDEMRKQGQELRRKMREGGGDLDRRAMWQNMQKARQEMQKKISEVLTPEQREKYKKQQEQMRQRWRRGRGGRDGGRGRGRWGRRGQNAEQMTKRLRSEAIKTLKLSEEESAVLIPLLDGVLESRKLLMDAQRKRRQKFLETVRATEDEAKLTELLKTYRKEIAEDKATLKKSQKQMIEALTPVQEAKLVALNILD